MITAPRLPSLAGTTKSETPATGIMCPYLGVKSSWMGVSCRARNAGSSDRLAIAWQQVGVDEEATMAKAAMRNMILEYRRFQKRRRGRLRVGLVVRFLHLVRYVQIGVKLEPLHRELPHEAR